MDNTILGHTQVQHQIHSQIASGNLPHALLLTGPSGIGKQLLAKRFAQAIFCNHSDENGAYGHCDNCTLFLSGNVPDYFVLDCNDKELAKTETIRELLYSLHLKTFQGDKRVIVMVDAEHLRPQAANALLKSLEEPHQGTHFILTAANHTQLLPTIVSRCQSWRLKELAPEEIITIAREKLPKLGEEALKVLSHLADGSVENIEHLQSHLGEWRKIKHIISAAIAHDPQAPQMVQEVLPKKKEEVGGIIQLLRIAARRELLQNPSEACAYLLAELSEIDNLIFERNINTQYLVQYIFQNIATNNLHAPGITEIAA